jgi:acetyl-CoA carboxylase biotin carboxylase subunit
MTERKSTIRRLLVANRGEIAVRVIRACREMGIISVAVYSQADRSALHVHLADEAYPLGGVTPRESYLNQQKILEVARYARVDAIHPGYGFLSENAAFVEDVERAGLIFVGPSSGAIRTLGDKVSARRLANKLGIPTVEGTIEPLESESDGIDVARTIGFPVLLKAAAGGGGKGMRVVHTANEFAAAFRMAQSEARTAFDDTRVYIEKYIPNPRHVEIQIMGDRYGNVLHLGERECSIQRRHQKVIEESPSPIVDETLRAQLGQAAVRAVREARYYNAGTVEFLLDADRHYYFLEVNTRLQVEHPVTEWITGIDLVKMQLQIAMGERLLLQQEEIHFNGHAIEARIYAEDPRENFFPSTGTLQVYVLPQGPRVRVDNGFRAGDPVSVHYDPLLAKVITYGRTRQEAIETMRRALAEFIVAGVRTTIPFCQFVLSHEEFRAGNFDTGFVANNFSPEVLEYASGDFLRPAAVAAVLFKSRFAQHSTSAAALRRDNLPPVSSWKRRREETYRQ